MLRSSQLTATPSRGVPVALRATVHGAVYSAGILVVIAWFVSVNHGDMGMSFFFWVIRATSIFEVGFLPFCVSTSICQEETLEKILHHVDIVEVLLVGWAFLPFQSGILPGSCRNDCSDTFTPT